MHGPRTVSFGCGIELPFCEVLMPLNCSEDLNGVELPLAAPSSLA